MRIAIVANSYQEARKLVECKFNKQVKEWRSTTGTYLLDNGDILDLCYDEANKEKYLSAIFDAIIIHPRYYSLLDVIRERCNHPS